MKKIFNAALVMLSVLAVAACSETESPDPIAVHFAQNSYTVVPASSLQIPFTIENGVSGMTAKVEADKTGYDFTVLLNGESAGTISFVAPDIIPEAETIGLTLTVTASSDNVATGNVSVSLVASDAISVAFENETYRFTPKPGGSDETLSYSVLNLGAATVANVEVSATNGWEAAKGASDNTVTVKVPEEGESSVVTVKVTDNFGRVAEASANLALNEVLDFSSAPANSFIIAPGSLARISVSHKGNSTADEDALSSVSAELVWQDAKGMVSSVEFEKESSTVLVQLANGISGNAVVATRGADEKINWSWHLWVTEYNPLAHAFQVYSPNPDMESLSDYYWVYMDRDLGATTDDYKSIDFCGLYYQWGRKDPFSRLVSHDLEEDQLGNRPVYNIEGEEVPIVFETVSVKDNLQNAIENPLTFYTAVNNTASDWYANEKLNPVPNRDLWGGLSHKKTIYDPCPDGWRVPEGNWVDYEVEDSSSPNFYGRGTANGFWPGFYVSFHSDDDPAVLTDEENCPGARTYFFAKLNLEDTSGRDGWFYPFSGWMSHNDGSISGSDVGDGNQLYNRAWIANPHYTVTSIKSFETTVSAFIAGGGLGVRTNADRASGRSVRCVKDIDFGAAK